MDAPNGSQDTEQTLDSQVKAFFDSAPPLQNRNDIIQKLNHFIQLNSLSSENGIGKRIVCVTSGGTTQAVNSGLLLKLPFSTIFEYLQMLQIISKPMKDIGPRAMFFLAAAVSDFYVPWKDMVEHKIQSGSHILDVKLVQVPKMLSVLRKDWAPVAFCISFKLETDSNILIKKARGALEKYNMHAVVANELSTRKEQVVVVTIDDKITVQRDKSKADDDVENPLIKLLSQRHSAYIEDSKRMR
ncbi:phosphopantothenate--cysteine ligase 1 [Arachis ipaensis]|uniref:phosphopantothenate--cysteine ligase 1 n=1 Tax=Arachis ipaensis TaxID=130454 RepID=UPI000A2AFAB5|nr:phosphopantothenate--cysteine ligase 1 [Arachis ipaensis]XP_020974429.1 phosphopantothenate--cysteine ligase 1 [Arachis ipaensis]